MSCAPIRLGIECCTDTWKWHHENNTYSDLSWWVITCPTLAWALRLHNRVLAQPLHTVSLSPNRTFHEPKGSSERMHCETRRIAYVVQSPCGLEIYLRIMSCVLMRFGDALWNKCHTWMCAAWLCHVDWTPSQDSCCSNSHMYKRVANYGNTPYFNIIRVNMLVRCNRMYNLLCNYLDNSQLDLSNDHVMCSNSSKNWTLYRA